MAQGGIEPFGPPSVCPFGWMHLPTRPLWLQMTLYKTLCNQCKSWKLIALNVLLKISNNS